MIMNEKYKQWISQYSKEYIEMSEWYYGEELPFDIYCKEFNITRKESTYLDSAKDVKELYALFVFFHCSTLTFLTHLPTNKYKIDKINVIINIFLGKQFFIYFNFHKVSINRKNKLIKLDCH